MTFFDSLLALLLAAILLLQVSRRLSLPYPAMLAGAGVLLALVPGAPNLPIDPHIALALFIAPALVDAGYSFPLSVARRLWRPLVTLAVVAVLATTAAVAWIGWSYAGLPIAAAVVLGAIVAPPDAAAATAVMRSVSLPKVTADVLRGESLFNDATALLLFTGGLAIASGGGLTPEVGVELAVAAPGGIALGLAMAWVGRWLDGFTADTLGGNLLQIVKALVTWVVAEHLHLSAVLAVVTLAMASAYGSGGRASPRMRVQSRAVWTTTVFLLNVVAFLLMGMQAREIVGRLERAALDEALVFAGLVVAAVIGVRFAIVIAWNGLTRVLPWLRGELPQSRVRQSVVVGWSGMRGLLTLATAFALPADFPQRDLVVLTAFAVVLATLVVQGLTLGPLIRLFKLDRMAEGDAELADARERLTAAALATLEGKHDPDAEHLRFSYEKQGDLAESGDTPGHSQRLRELALAAVAAERAELFRLRDDHLHLDAFDTLQEALDWRELTLLPDDDRRLEEN